MTDEYEGTESEPTGKAYSVRFPQSLRDAAVSLGDEIDRPFGWVVRNALAVYMARRGPALATEWNATETSGSCGTGYELRIMFNLPAAEDHDLLVYQARDAVQIALEDFGGRVAETRLVSLAPMPPDPRCVEASCAHLEE